MLLDNTYDYELKILTSIFKKDINIEDVKLIKSEWFKNINTKTIFKEILTCVKQYNVIPSIELITTKIQKKYEQDQSDKSKIELSTYIDTFSKIINVWDSQDIIIIKTELIKYIKDNELKDSILAIANKLSKDKNNEIDFDEYIKTIKTISSIGNKDDMGLDYLNTFDERYSENNLRKPISTGIPVFDKYLDGGSATGEMAIIAAPPGIGKSWLLIIVAANAILNGYTVVHYTLELSQYYVSRRYDSVLTQIPLKDLNKRKDEVDLRMKKILSNINTKTGRAGKLIIKQYPTKGATVDTLRNHIKLIKNAGTVPTIVIVDYGDILLDTTYAKSDNSYLSSGNIYENLRGLAGEEDVALWTASQTGRDSINKKIIYGDNISDSLKKLMIADFLVTFNRDKESNEASLFLVKSRNGEDGIPFNATFNAANGNLIIYPNDDKIKISETDGLNKKSEIETKNKIAEYIKNKNLLNKN